MLATRFNKKFRSDKITLTKVDRSFAYKGVALTSLSECKTASS
jgi:hypothetical protein